MTTESAYRSMDEGAMLRPRVEALEAKVGRAESAWRSTLWAGWRWLGWALLITLPLVGVGAVAFHGSLWGAAATAAAEREALRWGRTYWPGLTASSVYCSEAGATPTERSCLVRFPDRTSWRLCCDDDAPATNDGCGPAEFAGPRYAGTQGGAR